MTDVQQVVQEAIDQLVESGAERGMQVAVYRDGKQIADAVAGVADPATGRQVGSDTPSTTSRSARLRPAPSRTCSPSVPSSDTTPRWWTCGRSSARMGSTP